MKRLYKTADVVVSILVMITGSSLLYAMEESNTPTEESALPETVENNMDPGMGQQAEMQPAAVINDTGTGTDVSDYQEQEEPVQEVLAQELLEQPEEPVQEPQDPTDPQPEEPVTEPQAPTDPQPEEPVSEPQAPIDPQPEEPVPEPQAPADPQKEEPATEDTVDQLDFVPISTEI